MGAYKNKRKQDFVCMETGRLKGSTMTRLMHWLCSGQQFVCLLAYDALWLWCCLELKTKQVDFEHSLKLSWMKTSSWSCLKVLLQIMTMNRMELIMSAMKLNQPARVFMA